MTYSFLPRKLVHAHQAFFEINPGLNLYFFANQINAQTEGFDVVFKQARVRDLQTNLDAIRYVGVRGNKITVVSEGSIIGHG